MGHCCGWDLGTFILNLCSSYCYFTVLYQRKHFLVAVSLYLFFFFTSLFHCFLWLNSTIRGFAGSDCKWLANTLYADADLSFSYNWWHIQGHISSVVSVSGYLRDVDLWRARTLYLERLWCSFIITTVLLQESQFTLASCDSLSVAVDFYQCKLLTIHPTCAGSRISTKSQGRITIDVQRIPSVCCFD